MFAYFGRGVRLPKYDFSWGVSSGPSSARPARFAQFPSRPWNDSSTADTMPAIEASRASATTLTPAARAASLVIGPIVTAAARVAAAAPTAST